MANTVFKLRRSSVPGKVPNTDILSIGELALNLTDRKLYSSDGTNIFETGSNLTSLSVFSDIKVGNSTVNTSINSSSLSVTSIIANSSSGTSGQVLHSNGSATYWNDVNTEIAIFLSGNTIQTNSTVLSVGSNVFINTTSLLVGTTVSDLQWGTDSITWDVDSLSFLEILTTSIINDGILIGANLTINASSIFIGNSTVNTVINSSSVSIVSLIANGSVGNNQQILTSNGSGIYWADDSGAGLGTVTSISSGSGLTGGPITTTGTISVLANTGLIANVTGLHVNAAYINTISSNNTNFVGSVSAANVVSNAQLSANLSSYQTLSGLASNVALLTANNANNLGGISAAAYIQNTDSRTLSGNLVFSGANVAFTGNITSFQNTVSIDGGLTSKYLSFEYSNSCSMWSYSGTNFSVSAQETSPSGLFFTPNGTVMFITGNLTDSVIQYNLSTPWNVSTASFVKTANATIIGQTGIEDVFFSPNGSIMYTIGYTTDAIRQFSLSTPWDIDTISFVNSYSVAAQDTEPRGLYIKSDGTKAYIVGNQTDNTYEYTFGTPWNITTLSYTAGAFVNNTPQDTTCTGLDFEDDGKSLFIVGATGDCVYQYSLSTPWSVNSASFVALKYLGYEEGTPLAIWVDTSENKAWVVGSSADRVYEYKTNNFGLYANSVVNYITSNTEFENNLYVNGQLRSRGTITGLGAATFLSTLTGAGSVTFSTTTGTLSIGTSQSTGTTTVGGTTQTGSIQIGRSTATQIISIANGATTSGNTKTINIGTDSASGSNTNITIGSALGTSILLIDGNVGFGNNSPTEKLSITGNVVPSTSNTHDLGSSSLRWRNIYTNDLHLNNGIGDYTIVEGEDDLFLYNNKKNKVYKFVLLEVDANVAPSKMDN